MSGYSSDRAYSDLFIPAIQRVVGPQMLVVSTDEEDRTQATDMTILKGKDLKIACRVRRRYSPTGLDYLKNYGWQFTMRSKRDSGAETEVSKIVKGWGDWMFYGFAKADGSYEFDRWFLINLAHWRAQMMRRELRPTCGETPNGDGTYFTWFDIRSFAPTPRIWVAASEEIPAMDDEEVRKFWQNQQGKRTRKQAFAHARTFLL